MTAAAAISPSSQAVGSVEEVAAILTELRLKHFADVLRTDFPHLLPSEQALMLRCLCKWSIAEKSERRSYLIASRIKTAKFKRLQTVDQFDFSHGKAVAAIQKAYLALYHSVSHESLPSRHDAGLGTIATTNLPFGKFNQIFANDAIAHAIVDRLVNEAEVFFMEGTSYREHQRSQKHRRKVKPTN